MNKIATNTIYYSIGEIVPKIIGFIMLPIYTRYLSPSDYGIIAYTNSVVLFLFLFGNFCLNTYALRFYYVHKDDKERRQMLGSINIAILALNTIILGLSFLIMPKVISEFNIQISWDPFFKLAIINNFLNCLSTVPSIIYRMRQEALKFMILGVSRTLLIVFLTVYFVVYKKSGVVGTFDAHLYVYIVYALVYILIMRKYASYSFVKKYLIEGLKFSLPLLPGTLCYIMLNMSDRVILERNVGINELGIYNVASTMSLALNIVIQSGYKSFEPEFFKRYGEDGYFDYVKKVKSIFFFLIFICALCISLFSQEVFYFMTSEAFHEGYILVPAIITGVMFSGQNIIYQGILQGEKRTKVQGMATIIGAIISVTSNLLLVPIWGTFAAAFSMGVSFVVMNIILFTKMTFPNKSMYNELILVAIMLSISYGIFWMFDSISFGGICAKFICLIIYGIISARLFRVDLKTILFGVIRK